MSDSPVDKDALFELVDHDSDFLATLVGTFLDDCPDYMDAIREAVEAGDAETLVREAHGLKGAAANMQAEAAQVAARRLEEIGRSGNLDRAPDALEELETEIERLVPALETLVEET